MYSNSGYKSSACKKYRNDAKVNKNNKHCGKGVYCTDHRKKFCQIEKNSSNNKECQKYQFDNESKSGFKKCGEIDGKNYYCGDLSQSYCLDLNGTKKSGICSGKKIKSKEISKYNYDQIQSGCQAEVGVCRKYIYSYHTLWSEWNYDSIPDTCRQPHSKCIHRNSLKINPQLIQGCWELSTDNNSCNRCSELADDYTQAFNEPIKLFTGTLDNPLTRKAGEENQMLGEIVHEVSLTPNGDQRKIVTNESLGGKTLYQCYLTNRHNTPKYDKPLTPQLNLKSEVHETCDNLTGTGCFKIADNQILWVGTDVTEISKETCEEDGGNDADSKEMAKLMKEVEKENMERSEKDSSKLGDSLIKL